MSPLSGTRVLWLGLAATGLLFLVGCFALGSLILSGNGTLRRLGDEISLEESRQRTNTMENLEADLTAFSKTPSVKDAFEALDAGYRSYIPEHLRDLYVDLNPHRGESLSLLTDPGDGSDYSRAHARHHAWLRDYARIQDFRDVMFVRTDGQVIYSVRKGRTFATRISESDDELAGRQLAQIAREAASQGAVKISSGHASLLGDREVFAATALVDAEGKPLGSLVITRAAWAPAGNRAADSVTASAMAAWEARVKLASSGFGIVALLLLGGMTYLTARGSSMERQPALSLIPAMEATDESDSGRPGSYRSGTRPALSPDGRPDERLGSRAAGER